MDLENRRSRVQAARRHLPGSPVAEVLLRTRPNGREVIGTAMTRPSADEPPTSRSTSMTGAPDGKDAQRARTRSPRRHVPSRAATPCSPSARSAHRPSRRAVRLPLATLTGPVALPPPRRRRQGGRPRHRAGTSARASPPRGRRRGFPGPSPASSSPKRCGQARGPDLTRLREGGLDLGRATGEGSPHARVDAREVGPSTLELAATRHPSDT